MHAGRVGHPLNLPEGAQILAPSAVKPAGQMWTDQEQMQDYPIPKEMTAQDVQEAKAEYITAAKNAMIAGFDGVELHSANGYLLEQFSSPITNTRTDEYGGSIENRCKFIIEVATEVANIIGKDKTGIRVSPYGMASDMHHYPEINETYKYLAEHLNKIGIAYMHVVDHSAMGAPPVPVEIKQIIRDAFKNKIISAGGFNKDSAEKEVESGLGDLVAFGRPFINNPDLVARFENNWPLSTDLKADLFYSADKKGYTDYPVYQA